MPSTRNGRGLLIGAVAAAGVVVVLGVLAAGPVQVEAPRWSPAPRTPTPIVQPEQTQGPLLPAGEGSPVAQSVFRVILLLVLAAAAVAVVVALVLFVIRRIRDRRRRLHRQDAAGEVGGAAGVLGEDAVPAQAVRRGIARALEVLDQQRAPSDAVVQAWLGLEQAAEDAGAGRGVAETPAEYTARIVQRFDADRAAALSLLRLYQSVRFGGRSADSASVAAARGSLLRLQASWHEPEEAKK